MADNVGIHSAKPSTVQANPAELLMASLQMLKQKTHKLLDNQCILHHERDLLRAERDHLSAVKQDLSVACAALQTEQTVLNSELQELTTQRDSLEGERNALKAELGKLSAEHQELRTAYTTLHTEQSTLHTQCQALTTHLNAVQQERNSLLTEKEELSAQQQQLIERCNAISLDCQALRQLLEEVFPYTYIRNRNNIDKGVTNEEVLTLYMQCEERRQLLPLGFDQSLADAVNIKAAFLQIFPYQRYRALRSSFESLEDIELANHYIENGMQEGLQIEPEMVQ